MSWALSDEVVTLLNQLIKKIKGIEGDDSEEFKAAQKWVVDTLHKTYTLNFLCHKDIDFSIASLSDKFIFHGFWKQAKDLKTLYHKFINELTPKHEISARLQVVKFLTLISDNPTGNFSSFPKITFETEEPIDWPAYLNEGIERWSPPVDDSDAWSDDSDPSESAVEDKDATYCENERLNLDTNCEQPDFDYLVEYRSSKENLLVAVQSEWFNVSYVLMKPPSEFADANISMLWDNYINDLTRGFITPQKTSVISEYKVIREVIWQFYEPHSCYSYELVVDTLRPRAGVTISSVRAVAFEAFLNNFVPYIEALQNLRKFHKSLIIAYDSEDAPPPDTYRSYDHAIQNIVNPVFDSLQQLEYKVKEQESSMTLLKLAHELKPIFKSIQLLNAIHEKVAINFKSNSAPSCATILLTRLYNGLLQSSTKLEQDIYLSLYLESLYKYLSVIDTWLTKDVLEDFFGEFVILDANPKGPHNSQPSKSRAEKREQNWQMNFVIKSLDDEVEDNGIISIICTQVLQIGKNIHLLRLLRKLHLINESPEGSLYDAFVQKTLEAIERYSNKRADLTVKSDAQSEPQANFRFPATCKDYCKYPTEMDKLENLVDISDRFLMKAFQSLLIEEPPKQTVVEPTLFERISAIASNLFPAQQIVENVFFSILKEKFAVCGRIVKNTLLDEYDLKKHFDFLNHIFLYKEDLIFPLYRKIFEQIETKDSRENDIWMTSLLQDCIMDLYPQFYEKCNVEVRDNWKQCDDPLKACTMINLCCKIDWPVNVIIRDEHMELYRDLFQFLLKLKWALYILNTLNFAACDVLKLKMFQFNLLNTFSSIQHYILGYVYSTHAARFERNLSEACDLDSLVKAHGDFIHSIHRNFAEFRDYNSNSHGFYLLLYLVRKLRTMWNEGVDALELEKCEKALKLCQHCIEPIINPRSSLIGDY